MTLHRRGFRERVLRSAVHDPAHLTPEVIDGFFRPMRVRGHLRSMGRQMVDHRGDQPFDPSSISQPTLVLWGEDDRWIKLRQGERLAGAIPGARLVRVPAAGHLPLEEQPAFCNRELLRFLGTQDTAERETSSADAFAAR
jgi:pimeloyl-ACP methyl ester carboxylesterase